MITRLWNKFSETYWQYKFSGSNVRISNSDGFVIGKGSTIQNSNVFVGRDACFFIGAHCILKNVDIYIEKGCVIIDDYAILISEKPINKAMYIISNGNFHVNHHTKIQCDRVWIRFGGNVEIGSYTNINSGSEIRSDESVIIGSYNQISYDVNIWDTNTHTIYKSEKSSEITRKYFPYFGYEIEKPLTSPIVVGDNCWIGERSSIMKGTQIGDNVIVGYNTMLLNKIIESNKRVVQDINLRIL